MARRTLRTSWFLWSALAASVGGCGAATAPSASETIDAVPYFPIELGRYWVFFDSTDRFLTLEFTETRTLVGVDVHVLTYTFDRDTQEGAAVEPAYESYYAEDPEDGILLYGYRDHELGESVTYSPGIPFAATEMEQGTPIETDTARSGQLATFVTTLVARGIVQTYFGDFNDAIDITIGPRDGDQPKHFLARDKGLVKFDWGDERFQLYDYGMR